MVIARLTSKGSLVLLALVVAGAVGVGLALRVQARREGHRPPPQATNEITADWSWVDQLTNADAATKRRLLRCAKSAERNLAAIRRLSFDFGLTRQEPTRGDPGRPSLETLTYQGKVYWKDGFVRYDFAGDSPRIIPDDQGRPRPRGKGTYSVIRTNEMAAAIEDNPFWGAVLNVSTPPASLEAWKQQPSYLTHLDPWVHYAAFLRPGPAKLAEAFRAAKAIESREDGEGLHLRIVRDNGSWVEITCDPASDDLPKRTRAGGVRDGKSVTHVGTDDNWQKFDGVWYPTRHIELAFDGAGMPFKQYDWTARNLRVNDAAEVPDAVFTLSDMPLPEGAGGSDNRKSPPTELIKASGLVRQRRPTERAIRKSGKPSPPPGTATAPGRGAKENYLALVTEYETARQAADKAAMATEPGESLETRLAPLARVEAEFAARFLDFAAKVPNDPMTVDALGGVLVNRFTPRESERAAEILIRSHLQSKGIVPIYRQLGVAPLALSSGGEKFLRASLKGAPASETRGRAYLNLALLLKNRAEAIRELRGPNPDPLLLFTAKASGFDPRDVSRTGEPDGLEEEAVQHLEIVVEHYPDIQEGLGVIGEVARAELFRLQDLAVGKVAPEIEGPDADGKPFKLSDYRGQVVVLTFSGNWCGPCRAMYPHERELVERLKGRQFAFLSVNTDETQATLRDSIRSGEITWRCWWEGGEDRPNCTRYRVEQFPTIYVLDATGIIRARGVRGKALDEAVERLLKLD